MSWLNRLTLGERRLLLQGFRPCEPWCDLSERHTSVPDKTYRSGTSPFPAKAKSGHIATTLIPAGRREETDKEQRFREAPSGQINYNNHPLPENSILLSTSMEQDRPRTYFDISIGDKPVSTILIPRIKSCSSQLGRY